MPGESPFAGYTPDELSFISTCLAVAIAKDLDSNSLSVLSSVFACMASTMILIVRHRELLEGIPR